MLAVGRSCAQVAASPAARQGRNGGGTQPVPLPVLPFVLARADQPFLRSRLPLLPGMALTFAGVATLAAVSGGWAGGEGLTRRNETSTERVVVSGSRCFSS
jgi:hypothetical protein